jgi:hypothetical protein
MVTKKNKEIISAFERMKENAELNALAKEASYRPLDDGEFKRFKVLARKKIKGMI